jgi:hypothetical protein
VARLTRPRFCARLPLEGLWRYGGAPFTDIGRMQARLAGSRYGPPVNDETPPERGFSACGSHALSVYRRDWGCVVRLRRVGAATLLRALPRWLP